MKENGFASFLVKRQPLFEEKDYALYKCPFCGNDTFIVNKKENIYMCFSKNCLKGGNSADFQMRYCNKTASSIFRKNALKEVASSLYEVNRYAASILHSYLMKRDNPGYTYLSETRRLDDITLKRFSLGWCPKNSDLYKALSEKFDKELLNKSGLFATNAQNEIFCKFAGRVIFPIFDITGRIAGFGGRVTEKQKSSGRPKYINSAESLIYDKGSMLYGMNFALKTKRDYMIICEGYMDVISLHEAGFDCAVAPLGTAFTDDQAEIIRSTGKRIILMQDTDAAGETAKKRAYEKLKEVDLKIADLNPAKDPDEYLKTYGKESFEEKIDTAESFLAHSFGMIKKTCNPKDFTSYLEFGEAAADLLMSVN